MNPPDQHAAQYAAQHPDPGGEAAARAAQLAAMLVSVAEAAARLRAHRQAAAAAVAAQDAAAVRALRRAEAATARVVYGAALDDAWLRQAPTSGLLDAWDVAGPYRRTDPTASAATDRVEDRLRRLHPEAMTAYDVTRAAGFPREDCLYAASLLWRGEYGLDPIGTPVAHNLTDHTPAHHATASGAPTSHATATRDPADRQHRSTPAPAAPGRPGTTADPDAPGDRPAHRVVVQTFPVDARAAMTTAPAAARTRLALTAAPQRLQLTATPHIPRTPRSTR